MKIVPSTVNCLKRKGDKKANSLLAGINANEMANTKKKDIIAMSPKKIELNFSP